MPSSSLVIPHARACCWFEEDPQNPLLPAGAAHSLEVGWDRPGVDFVEPMLRRRLSRLARGFFHCAQRLAPPENVRVVFASRHGEVDRTLSILQELAAGREVSPALFSMSVHNAVAGIWSIFKGNRAPMSALAAGPETFGWGLVEAIATWRADPAWPVLYVYADDRLPEPWAAGLPQPGLHAVALLLGGDEGPELTLLREPSPGGPGSPEPQSHHFLEAWRGGQGAWQGPEGCWQWQFA